MVNSEQRRRLLHDGVATGLGADVADALMDLLPPAGWSDLATRQDVEHATALVQSQLAAQLAAFREGLSREMSAGQNELRKEMNKLRKEMVSQTRTIMLGMLGTVVAMFGAVAGLAATLGH